MPRATQVPDPSVWLSSTGLSPCFAGLSSAIRLCLAFFPSGPTTPMAVATGLGCSTFARHYSRNTLFSSKYLDVSVPSVPFPCGMTRSSRAGFPHSDIVGSTPAHNSPTLFAVYHVLLRLLSPRHPPCAFFCFFSHAENSSSLLLSRCQLSANIFRPSIPGWPGYVLQD